MESSWKYTIWTQKKYIDFWSLNHALAGGFLAGFAYFSNIGFWFGFAVSIFLMLAWELFEYLKSIEEPFPNTVIDMITGILGYFFLYYIHTNLSQNIMIFLVIMFAWFFLEIWGYIAYKKGIAYRKKSSN